MTEDGALWYTDVPNAKLFKLEPGGKPELSDGDTGKANGLELGPDV